MNMILDKIEEVVIGFINDTLPNNLVPQVVLDLANIRKEDCDKCKLNINNKCSKDLEDIVVKDFDYHGELRFKGESYSGCNCFLSKKQKSSSSICPLGKW